MQKIDTTNWLPFKVGDLFRIKGGKGITKFEISTHEGSLPAIQSGEANFGCIGYIDKDYCISKGYVLSEGECLTVARSGSSGYVGHQASQCVVGDSAKILEPKFEANTLRLLFLRAILMVNKKKYAYIDKVTNENYARDIILLPAIDKTTPNWQYMEDYMRGIEQKTASTLLALSILHRNSKRVNTCYWEEFDLKKLGFKNYHGKRLTKQDRIDGSIPFITAGKENQGVVGNIGNNWPVYHNPITIDMFGNVFYHQGNYAGDDNIYFFVNDDINDFCKLFIVTSINKALKSIFAYVDQFRQDNADSLKIKLPATPDGEPDWQYMEMYMRGVEAIAKNKIDALQQSKQSVAPTPQTPFTNYGTVSCPEKSRHIVKQ